MFVWNLETLSVSCIGINCAYAGVRVNMWFIPAVFLIYLSLCSFIGSWRWALFHIHRWVCFISPDTILTDLKFSSWILNSSTPWRHGIHPFPRGLSIWVIINWLFIPQQLIQPLFTQVTLHYVQSCRPAPFLNPNHSVIRFHAGIYQDYPVLRMTKPRLQSRFIWRFPV